MKLIMENWRRFISESNIHPNIMSQINKAEKMGLHIKIFDHGIKIYKPDSDNLPTASITWDDDPVFGPCLKSKIVSGAYADEGLGPLAYDIAIEASGGLVSDRTEVSNAARDVWDYYDNNRPDVIKQQMDNLENELTPEEKDNCEQLTADQDDQSSSWKDSSLSKKYSKPHGKTPVIDELIKRRMLHQKPALKNDFPADGMTPSKYNGDLHPGGIP